MASTKPTIQEVASKACHHQGDGIGGEVDLNVAQMCAATKAVLTTLATHYPPSVWCAMIEEHNNYKYAL